MVTGSLHQPLGVALAMLAVSGVILLCLEIMQGLGRLHEACIMGVEAVVGNGRQGLLPVIPITIVEMRVGIGVIGLAMM
jgi:hypothetical protein